MKKSFILLMLLFSILICELNNGTVYAITNDEPQPLEEIYPEIGYKTVEEAVKEFEQHFKQDLKLPLRIPPISFTHYFGRFSDLDGDANDSFEMKFISDKSPENHYKIVVRPVNHKIPIRDKYILKVFKLKNGNAAKYMEYRSFGALVFERDNWQYMLSIDKRISNKVTPEVLVEIANSIDYPRKKKKPLQ
ncbi:hypothetical protein [Bacillus sp. REN16]|uniref:hypothetical protein n=1 Tax=Bacillus sp. REN16 TaxID=2887296 RepID=UPI001E596D98|nr:hypothetical protein [Bacillus sp. REN16]MCC3357076.1 hypothetical protein [Bacillus sp. REN16]